MKIKNILKKSGSGQNDWTSKLSGPLRHRRAKLYIVLILFALIGTGALLYTQAAPANEPEAWSGSNNIAGCVQRSADVNASGGEFIDFRCGTTPTDPHENHNETCTPGSMGTMGPCVNKSLIPAPRPGVSTVGIKSGGGNSASEVGAFRTRCDFSHMNNDDPILYPGATGKDKAHLHTFFGNTGTNNLSTSASLKNSGNSTCSGGIINRSAYWIPTIIDTTTGRPVTPKDDRSIYNSDLEIYYKTGYLGVNPRDIKPFPQGLTMIAGNAANSTSAPIGEWEPGHPRFSCESSNNTDRNPINPERKTVFHIPLCNTTTNPILLMDIKFPQCWDGRNLTSANGRSHMAYGKPAGSASYVGCPSTHPVPLPEMEMKVRWRITAENTNNIGDTRNWRFSSDNYPKNGNNGGYSAHADYMFAWGNETHAPSLSSVFDTITSRCYNTSTDCQYNYGDGHEPMWEGLIR